MPQQRKVRIIPNVGVDHEAQIRTLHTAIRPCFATVVQDLSPRAPSRFPCVRGGYTVQFQSWTAMTTVLLALIEQHGFTIDPASMTEPKAVSPPPPLAVA